MPQVKVAEWMMRFLVREGVRDVFMVTGGGAMHLNDAAGHTDGLNYVCTVHEQAAAMAAESYAKVTGGLGCCIVTAGPGGTNALTGVAGAWLDSTPMIVLSGQVKRADLKGDSGVRQLGVQEVDIVAMAAPITKYAVTVLEPESIRMHLERAVWTAREGRPGPVWIDMPLDVQGALVEEDALPGFEPAAADPADRATDAAVGEAVARAVEILRGATRPVVLVGNGVRLSGARDVLRRVIDRLGVPVLTTWPAHDMVPDDHPLMHGRPGPVAPRGANFTLQNCDALLCIGARLDNVVTGYAPANFARAARKVVVDIDAAEVARVAPTVELAIATDAGRFLHALERALDEGTVPRAWIERCDAWRSRYPVVLDEYRSIPSGVSTYVLAETLAAATRPNDIIVSGSSGAGIEIFNLAMRLREGQRLFLTTALGAMGNGLPAVIGAAVAAPGRRVISVDGDGGFQLNIQELELLRRLSLDVKIFILANDGYASIRTSQERYFGRLTGADATSGVTVPSLRKVADAFGVAWVQIAETTNLRGDVEAVLARTGPVICEVATPREEIRAPSLSSVKRADGSMVSRPLEDLWPFLPREEFEANMIIPPLPE